VHGVSVTEAHSADYKIPSGEVGDGPQEGNFQADDGLDGLSDAGSLNSEEEHELEEYFKKIKEEKGEGRGGDKDHGVLPSGAELVLPSGAELAAIPEASSKLSGVRRSKHRASESDVDEARQAEPIEALQNEGNPESASGSISFDNVSFAANLELLGMVLGANENSSSRSHMEL
jgi:hypothetical protein